VPVVSRWVRQFILTDTCELAVQFKNHRGEVCCLYPGTNKALFELAITWPSPGKFVHRFLYRKLPYRLIVPPCKGVGARGPVGNVFTACGCLPPTVRASIRGVPGSVVMTYDEPSGTWSGQGLQVEEGGIEPDFTLICVPVFTLSCRAPARSCQDFALTAQWSRGPGSATRTADAGTCSLTPTSLTFSNIPVPNLQAIGGHNACPGTITVTVTQ
jgi:hypothetical protein